VKAILLNRALIVLAFVGLFLAGVLSLEAGMNLVVPCGPSGGCAKVAADPSAHFLFGIPNAYLGVAGYLALAGLAILRSLRPTSEWRGLVSMGYIIASLGTLFSLGLQYYSLTVIHATCLWCLGSAVTMVVILIVYAMLAQEMENLPAAGSPTAVDAEDSVIATMGFRTPKADIGLVIVLPLVLIIGLATMASTMKASTSVVATGDFSKVEFVPKNANVFGVSTSPVTVVEFADLCCPACQRTSPLVKEFVIQHPGKIRLVYRHYPLTMHELAEPAAVIAECMADDDRFWEFAMSVLALNRQPKDVDELLSLAQGAGADTAKIMKRLEDVNDPAYGRVERDLGAVKKLGITSTPTFFIMTEGKVRDVVGPTDVLNVLSGSKYKDKIGEAHS